MNVPNFLVIPIDAMFDEGVGPTSEYKGLSTIAEVEMIFGRDVMTGNLFVVYGRELLSEIAGSGVARSSTGVIIELDQKTKELEKLLALVQALKGKHDYEATK